MDQTALRSLVQAAQADRYQVLIQCLPKTGSTSVSVALSQERAVHELEMNAVLSLARLRGRANFEQQRSQWLKARQQRLRGRVDVCTALALVIADLDDQQLKEMGWMRLRLNRSLRPWLHSISNWSFIHRANAYRQSWISAYRAFVSSADPTLSAWMPTEIGNLAQMVQFWIPVWLTYQKRLHNIAGSRLPTILTDTLKLDIHANSSNFSGDYEQAFASLVPELPNLSADHRQNQAVTRKLREWWLSRHEDWPG